MCPSRLSPLLPRLFKDTDHAHLLLVGNMIGILGLGFCTSSVQIFGDFFLASSFRERESSHRLLVTDLVHYSGVLTTAQILSQTFAQILCADSCAFFVVQCTDYCTDFLEFSSTFWHSKEWVFQSGVPIAQVGTSTPALVLEPTARYTIATKPKHSRRAC